MTLDRIALQRLANQRLVSTEFTSPAGVVAWLGAVQSQDYPAGKWAVAQRTTGLDDADLDRAFAAGEILRTHVMRPTWHFVTTADIRWMLKLTAPRIHATMAQYLRRQNLDSTTLARTGDLLATTLRDGKQLTRAEIATVMEEAGLNTNDLFRLGLILMHAELEGVICSGAMRGKQHTYALLDDRAPKARTLSRDEALAELALRYFTSHGPAQIKDYIWWSGLAAADARAGLDLVKDKLAEETFAGQVYWFDPASPAFDAALPTVHLLPNYDEYIVGYTDRTAVHEPEFKVEARGGPLFSHTVIVNGRLAGIWKRTLKKKAVEIDFTFHDGLPDEAQPGIAAEAQRFGRFLGLDPVII